MKKILLVEDNLLLANNIKTLLESEMFDVKHANSSEEGFEILLNDYHDLIISDIMLPGKDGYEFLNLIKEKFGNNTPPFIFITAKSRRIDQRKSMELGADDFISKPFTIDELLNAINVQIIKREQLVKQKESKSHKSEILKYVEQNLDSSVIGEPRVQYNGFLFIDEKNEQGYFPIKKLFA